MQKPRVGHLCAFLVACTFGLSLRAQDQAETSRDFGLTNVWTIELTVSPEEYDAMQPALPGPPGAPPVAPSQSARASERNLFGTAFPWAEAQQTINGLVSEKVGVRYAGDFTYFVTARNLKRPLAIRIGDPSDRVGKAGRTLHLHAMPLGPAKAREAIALSIFRRAGVPTPATAFAEVSLTVSGRHEKALLGLYTVLEEIDAPWLADQFENNDGLLMKPVRMRGIDFLGDDWAPYARQYQPHREATARESKRIIDFARLINQGSDDEFQKRIGDYLDIESFLRFQIANALTSSRPLAQGQQR